MINAKCLRQLVQRDDCWISLPPFKPAQVLLTEPRTQLQLLLCEALLATQASKILSNKFAHIHAADALQITYFNVINYNMYFALYSVSLPGRDISSRQQGRDISPKRTSQNNQLYDINPTLAAFNPRNKGLMALQSRGQLRLRQTRSFAGIRQRLAQRFVPLTSDRLCHADANPLSHQR